MTVSNASLICICITMILGIVIPAGLILFLRKKTRGTWKAFFWGCGIFFLFAMVLESLVHRAVRDSSMGQTIWNTPILYALYGGLMAGIFEECGRFLAFRIPLKKELGEDDNALTYAAGHGGFEFFNILFFTMLNNLIYASVMSHPDKMAQVYAHSTPEQAEQIRQVYELLAVTPAWNYFLSVVERCSALILHFGFSVLVWFAVKKGGRKLWLFVMAILLHAFVDGSMVMIQNLFGNAVITEICVFCAALAVGAFGLWIWKKEKNS